MNLLYEKESFEIRGACFWIWKELGAAFKESIIDNALTEELIKRGLKIENQKRINIYYHGKKVGTYVPDKIINNAIILEIKSKPHLTNQDVKQFWHYLKGTDYKLGFLINFGEKLEIKRVIYDEVRIREKISASDPREDQRLGFTLIEVLVATTIFAIVAASMMALFNYTLKINRRSEALRQSTQGIRNFTEYIVKTVRNGQIDYSVKNAIVQAPINPCPKPAPLAASPHDGSDTYQSKSSRLGLITNEGERMCLYLGDSAGNAVPSGFVGETLVLEKTNFKQVLNPPYFKIENLMFVIRPLEDPYYTDAGGLIRIQPAVTIIMKSLVQLPTGEIQPIYYQTTISSDKYDVPSN